MPRGRPGKTTLWKPVFFCLPSERKYRTSLVGDDCTISTKKIKYQKYKFDVNCTRAGLELTVNKNPITLTIFGAKIPTRSLQY